jgi:hypothetical protein
MLIIENIPKAETTPFTRTTDRDLSRRGNIFISKMLQLDWRDRPRAKELFEDEWWNDEMD